MITKFGAYGHKLAHVVGKPIMGMETPVHWSYLLFAFMEGKGGYSMTAGVLLLVVVISNVMEGVADDV